ncbi:MAG: Asp-tRNA(Asn)/Glu-tRNA(Gln) amidotransferase subunit GatC [Candidatus Brennerbacteria bacterium]
MLNEKDVENLAELARIRLTESEKEHALYDLEKILAHVAELKEVETDGIPPMAGGTALTNGVRADEGDERLAGDVARGAFPEEKGGFLKVPPVFE